MKIIKDQSLIEHRLALQDLLVEQISEFRPYMQNLSVLLRKPLYPMNRIIRSLHMKVQSIAVNYYELQYGNYFYKLNATSRTAVIDRVVGRYMKELADIPAREADNYASITIFPYLEQSIKEEKI